MSLLHANEDTPTIIEIKHSSSGIVISCNGAIYTEKILSEKLKMLYNGFGKDEYIQIHISENVSIQEILTISDIVHKNGFLNMKVFIPSIENDSYFLQEVIIYPKKEHKYENVPPL